MLLRSLPTQKRKGMRPFIHWQEERERDGIPSWKESSKSMMTKWFLTGHWLEPNFQNEKEQQSALSVWSCRAWFRNKAECLKLLYWKQRMWLSSKNEHFIKVQSSRYIHTSPNVSEWQTDEALQHHPPSRSDFSSSKSSILWLVLR